MFSMTTDAYYVYVLCAYISYTYYVMHTSAGSVSTNMQLQRLQVALQGLLEKCEQITRRISAGKLDSNHSAGDILVCFFFCLLPSFVCIVMSFLVPLLV